MAGRGWQRLKSGYIDFSESAKKSDSAVKINVSSDKLKASLQKVLDYRKEREKSTHYIREFGYQVTPEKTDKSNLH